MFLRQFTSIKCQLLPIQGDFLFGLEERQVAGNPKQKDDLPHGTARKQGYLFPRICVNLCSSVGGYMFPLIALIYTDILRICGNLCSSVGGCIFPLIALICTDMLRFSVYPFYPWDTTSART